MSPPSRSPATGHLTAAATDSLPPLSTVWSRRAPSDRAAVKTSLDSELALLLPVGADAHGNVQVVSTGEKPAKPAALVDTTTTEELDFAAGALDLQGLRGVQDKPSASMLISPLALRRRRTYSSLIPPEYLHLGPHVALHLSAARNLKIPVAKASVGIDKRGTSGLLVDRLNRQSPDGKTRTSLPSEDAAQVMGIPPASKSQPP
ncbi:hypothetical protein LJ754_16310 [Arthrobacter sp. zg-Y40]|uniref:hypothetical protein n=1 Tax=Arthrobacter sp. zg-Y40 TaxID=2886939 RepID=UPI001D137CCA|nr:hypothetical protein [Arthrobacter sp. zg-Y40]MCC3280711.1 hypothetical protein [Arthrobacter sp. zg-Y40]